MTRAAAAGDGGGEGERAMDFADRTLYGNELPAWLAAGGVALAVFLAIAGLSRFLHHRAATHARATEADAA
ncbi:MAG: hypothetical protein EXR43_04160 [Dehalococcoidia bacterium]|nr:hypothetical protein [Dehalococcoidia bacterium]